MLKKVNSILLIRYLNNHISIIYNIPKEKKEIAKNKGFDIIEIWSDDSNKNLILENLIKKYKNENKENN